MRDSRTINELILHKQHLGFESRTDDIVQTVQDIGGLHAQIPETPYLSLFIRTNNFNKAKLDEELYMNRNLARIKCIRRTLYIFPKHMISSVFSATRRLLEIPSESYMKFLGISHQEYEEISKRIIRIMDGQGLTTKEIKNEIGAHLDVSLIVNLMCDQGLLIRGEPKAGWKSNIHTYYPFNAYFPDLDLYAVEEADARRSLVMHYIASFGPVSEKDISWWTGFSKGETKLLLKSISDEINQFEIQGFDGIFFSLTKDEKILGTIAHSIKPSVNLLPALDPFIMGYKERERFLDYNYYANVFDFNGNATSTILVDGKIVGVWDFIKETKPCVKIFLFEKLESDVVSDVICKAEEIGQFIAEENIGVLQCHSMVPLIQRTAGGYRSPLKDSRP